MTTFVVVLIGAGLLLIVSAIEDASLVKTFQVIWNGQPISTLAGSNASSVPTKNTNVNALNQRTTGAPFKFPSLPPTLPPGGRKQL